MRKLTVVPLIVLAVVLAGCDSSSPHGVTLQVTGTVGVTTANIIYEVGTSGWVGPGGWTTVQPVAWSTRSSLQHGPISLNAVTTGVTGSLTVTILIDGIVWKTATVTTTGEQEVAAISGVL